MYQTVRYEKQDNIGIATINRPEALNALNSTVIADLEALIGEVEKDTSMRCEEGKMDKIDAFFDKVEKQGLGKAFNEITEIAHSEFGMSLGDMIEATVKSQKRPQCRIRYRQIGDISEHYFFEIRQSEDEEWTFICCFELKNDMLHYTMLEKIREMVDLGYEICFA